MRQLVSSLTSRAATMLGWVACLILLLIMATTFVDVIGRTTSIGSALIGTVEVVELLMGILVFSGLALTEVKRKHIAVDTFQSLFPKPIKKLSVVLNLILAVGITTLLAQQLIIKAFDILNEQEHTQILEIPYWPTAMIMSVGIVLFLLVLILRLIDAILGPHKDKDSDDMANLS